MICETRENVKRLNGLNALCTKHFSKLSRAFIYNNSVISDLRQRSNSTPRVLPDMGQHDITVGASALRRIIAISNQALPEDIKNSR